MTFEEFAASVESILTAPRQTLEERMQAILDAAEDFAAHEVEETLHPPLRLPGRPDGFAREKRSSEKEAAS